MQSSASQITTKEISKGVFLHKQQVPPHEGDGSELLYLFKVIIFSLWIYFTSINLTLGLSTNPSNTLIHS